MITAANAPAIHVPSASGGKVDASCNTTITVACLKELYNAVGYTPQANTGNKVSVTGYLDQFANINDLQLFYADQVPSAVNSSFKIVSINGGFGAALLPIVQLLNWCDVDTQFAFGIAHPIPATFYTTAGSPPFIPDIGTPTDSNEPCLQWVDFVLSHPNPPQTIRCVLSCGSECNTADPRTTVRDEVLAQYPSASPNESARASPSSVSMSAASMTCNEQRTPQVHEVLR